MNKTIKYFLIIDTFFFIIYLLFKFLPEITEFFYSRGIFPIITLILGFITDLFLFSVSEILIILLFLFLLILPFLIIIFAVKNKFTIKNTLFLFLKTYFIVISVVVIWFYAIWGFNYFRKGLPVGNDIVITDDKFDKTTRFVIYKTNELYTNNDLSKNELENLVYSELHTSIKNLTGIKIYPAKKVKHTFTNTLENTNTSGMISPFSLESHLSKELLDCETPSILAHEKSHLHGIAHETEANFIAFLTCIRSKNKFVQYSGYFEVLSYFLSQYRNNHTEEEYKKLYLSIREEVREEFKKQKERYDKHKSKFNDFLLDIYDLYLKSNNISEGSKAYSEVVQMIIKSNILEDEIKNFN
ncbi:MAG: DUF3810 family protein [Spirochaetes bacterium]|nr:DUF3810 family protein [Spirochaetota bacterium]